MGKSASSSLAQSLCDFLGFWDLCCLEAQAHIVIEVDSRSAEKVLCYHLLRPLTSYNFRFTVSSQEFVCAIVVAKQYEKGIEILHMGD